MFAPIFNKKKLKKKKLVDRANSIIPQPTRCWMAHEFVFLYEQQQCEIADPLQMQHH
jgi:hypothetical protein